MLDNLERIGEVQIFRTANGTLLPEQDFGPEISELGFVLRDEAIEHDEGFLLHRSHLQAAQIMINMLGILPNSRVINSHSNMPINASAVSPHIDGLYYKFIQAHSTHKVDGFADSTEFTFYKYTVGNSPQGIDEHAALQDLADYYNYLGPDKFIPFHPNPVPDRKAHVPLHILIREPDKVTTFKTLPTDTLFFPNGYGATPVDSPGIFTVHSTRSCDAQTGDPVDLSRVISISRIEPMWHYLRS